MSNILSPQEQARGTITLLHLAEAEAYVWVSLWKTDDEGKPRKEFKADRHAARLRLTPSGAEAVDLMEFPIKKDYQGRLLGGVSATPTSDPFIWMGGFDYVKCLTEGDSVTFDGMRLTISPS